MDFLKAFQKISQMTTRALLGRMKEKPSTRKKEGFVKHPQPPSPLFGARKYIHRRDLREFLEKKAPRRIPGREKLTPEELLALEKEVFPEKKFGSYITLPEFKKAIRFLRKEKRRAKGWERRKIKTKIKFLEDLLPKKDER